MFFKQNIKKFEIFSKRLNIYIKRKQRTFLIHIQLQKYDFFQKREKFRFFSIFNLRGDPLILKVPYHIFGFFKNWFSFFKKWPLWDLANVKRNKVMKFGYSNHQIVKMLDWVWSSGPDLAPLSRNRVNREKDNCLALDIPAGPCKNFCNNFLHLFEFVVIPNVHQRWITFQFTHIPA